MEILLLFTGVNYEPNRTLYNYTPPLVSEEQFVTDGNIVEALEATEEDLLVVHTKSYLSRLKV